jgi:hypothetical protein
LRDLKKEGVKHISLYSKKELRAKIAPIIEKLRSELKLQPYFRVNTEEITCSEIPNEHSFKDSI